MLFVMNMPTDAREKLLFAGLELFTSKGFKETSILEIVELARVSKTTFYQYFSNKDELLASLFQQLAAEIIEEVENAVRAEKKVTEKGYVGIRRYIELCITRSTVARLLLVESVGVSQEVEKVRREAHRQFANLFYRTALTELPIRLPEDEVRVFSQAMVGAINEVVYQNLFESDGEVQLERLARLLNRIVVGTYLNFSNE